MPETLEAEVIEVDGHAPPPPPERGDSGRRMRQVVMTLDRRWWPLWAVLGVLALGLVLTVGVVFAAVYLVYLLIRGVLRGVASFLTGAER